LQPEEELVDAILSRAFEAGIASDEKTAGS